jgi:hypothetical protein
MRGAWVGVICCARHRFSSISGCGSGPGLGEHWKIPTIPLPEAQFAVALSGESEKVVHHRGGEGHSGHLRNECFGHLHPGLLFTIRREWQPAITSFLKSTLDLANTTTSSFCWN